MRINVIGGGPAGLYFSILMKKATPSAEIEVFERNGPDDTFGWGVVFSDETLSGFRDADPESFQAIHESFAYWGDIETYFGGRCVTSTGHGFCGLSRKRLLNILQARCRELGVALSFHVEIGDVTDHMDADLVVAADGVNSAIRDRFADSFRPSIDWRRTRFCWLGTDLRLGAFTFHFKENEHGLWRVHAYPFDSRTSTWIVECRADTLARAGLEEADEATTVAYCEELFREELDGHRLLTNRSVWRTFPTIRCASWRHENVVLMGDACHTAHFSIGSGTKLAMEDAIALVEAFEKHGTNDVPAVLASYEDARHVDVIKTQKAAQTSLEWFENTERYTSQEPEQFKFNLMTRSKRITYDNLALRDPSFVAEATEWFRKSCDAPLDSNGNAPPPCFTPYRLRDLELANRIVVSPMCQYSATEGTVDDWHLVHLGSRAVGGAGLVITEMTNVTAEGRITPGCAGLYTDEHTAAWKRIVDYVHRHTPTKIGIQLAHAGRKGSTAHPWEGPDVPLTGEAAWATMGPSALPFDDGWPTPREMTREDMDGIRDAFVRATERAEEAGFDLVEVHMAHGYLLSSFVSPLSNRRDDSYGGDLDGRLRYPLEVFEAMRAAWPAEKPMSVRISATDWLGDEGTTAEDSVELARRLKALGCDVIDVSSAGNSPRSEPEYGRMYQVPFADRIRHEVEMPVMAVGAILGADHANTILLAGRADLCAMARPHLRDAYLTSHAATEYEFPDHFWPGPYLAGKPAPKAE